MPESDFLNTLPPLEKPQLTKILGCKPIGHRFGKIDLVKSNRLVAQQVEASGEQHFGARMSLQASGDCVGGLQPLVGFQCSINVGSMRGDGSAEIGAEEWNLSRRSGTYERTVALAALNEHLVSQDQKRAANGDPRGSKLLTQFTFGGQSFSWLVLALEDLPPQSIRDILIGCRCANRCHGSAFLAMQVKKRLTCSIINGYNINATGVKHLPGMKNFVGNSRRDQSTGNVVAGGAAVEITPRHPTFLYGYPHVPRVSTGVHDPLLASALYLNNGAAAVLFVQVDLIWLAKQFVMDIRAEIAARTGIPTDHILVSASHTHSGPVTTVMLSNAEDAVVPPPDPAYLTYVADGIVSASEKAVATAEPAEVAVFSATCTTIGSNRHDPSGPRITEIPVVAARAIADPQRWLAVMFVNPVHPTVLHEDSTLISGDFPAMCRQYLQSTKLGATCPVLCPLGAAGNQSPRYVVRGHSTAEARRLGELLGVEINRSLESAIFVRQLRLSCESASIELPLRCIPSIESAATALESARGALESLKNSGTAGPYVRTAECAVFGAEETVALAKAAAENGRLEAARERCLPVEINVIGVGKRRFVGWPGEVFVEFALRLHDFYPDAAVITLANGELQGYLVTAEAVQQRCYEAGNAIFASPESGDKLVATTLELLARTRGAPAAAAAR